MSPLPVGDQLTVGTYIGVGVGVGVFILIVLVIMVGLILVVVMRRKTVLEQNEDMMMDENPYYNKTAVMEQEIDISKKGLSAINEDPNNDKSEENGSIINGFDPSEIGDSEVWIKTTEKPTSEVSTTPASAGNIEELYAVVDKSKKKGTKKEREGGAAAADRGDLYSMPMKKKGMIIDEGHGVVESVDVEKGEEYDDMVGLKYEPMADSKSGQQSEGDGKTLNVDLLYAVVDKSRKKKQ